MATLKNQLVVFDLMIQNNYYETDVINSNNILFIYFLIKKYF
jgi:hypothetical protein